MTVKQSEKRFAQSDNKFSKFLCSIINFSDIQLFDHIIVIGYFLIGTFWFCQHFLSELRKLVQNWPISFNIPEELNLTFDYFFQRIYLMKLQKPFLMHKHHYSISQQIQTVLHKITFSFLYNYNDMFQKMKCRLAHQYIIWEYETAQNQWKHSFEKSNST